MCTLHVVDTRALEVTLPWLYLPHYRRHTSFCPLICGRLLCSHPHPSKNSLTTWQKRLEKFFDVASTDERAIWTDWSIIVGRHLNSQLWNSVYLFSRQKENFDLRRLFTSVAHCRTRDLMSLEFQVTYSMYSLWHCCATSMCSCPWFSEILTTRVIKCGSKSKLVSTSAKRHRARVHVSVKSLPVMCTDWCRRSALSFFNIASRITYLLLNYCDCDCAPHSVTD